MKAITQRLKSDTNKIALIISTILVPLELNFHMLRDVLGDNYAYAFIGFSIVMVAMREVTTQSVKDL